VEIASRFAKRRELRSRVFGDAVAQERRVFGAERARVGHGVEACGLGVQAEVPRARDWRSQALDVFWRLNKTVLPTSEEGTRVSRE
jgi:hypothetical protein